MYHQREVTWHERDRSCRLSYPLAFISTKHGANMRTRSHSDVASAAGGGGNLVEKVFKVELWIQQPVTKEAEVKLVQNQILKRFL